MWQDTPESRARSGERPALHASACVNAALACSSVQLQQCAGCKRNLLPLLLSSGNARWAPPVSEYRQASLKAPLQHAAEGMLTTAPPADAEQLVEGTAQLTTLGRCVEVAVLSGSKPFACMYSHFALLLQV